MLEGIPKKEYPRLFYRYFKEFLEVLAGKTSLKLYLAHNYPSLYKPKFKEGEKLKWKGFQNTCPKISELYKPSPDFCHLICVLLGQYSIPQCDVKENDIVFDIGAHIGFFSYFALQKGAKEVYAFEPNPYVFEILKKHAEMWSDKIKPFEIALYSSNGFQELLIPNPLTLESTLVLKKIGGEKVKVKTMTLDSFVKEYNVERVDFIKIDAEGSEREIIKGAKETIKRFKPKMAIAAYHLPDDKKVISGLVLSIRDDYKFKLVKKGEEDLFFF
jgi:FkbM family methyltransferase